MSVLISAWVWKRSSACGNDLLVLLALADQAHDNGTCWPSIKNISHRCRCCERTVQRSIDDLVAMGELKVEPRFDLENHQTSNRYTVVTIGLSEVIPPRCQIDTPPVTMVSPVGDSSVTPPGDSSVTLNVKEETLLLSSSSSTQKRDRPIAAKPNSEQEVVDLCKELELPGSDAQYIWNHWHGNGFTVAGKPMKRWRQVIRSWKAAGYMPSQQQRKFNGHKAPETQKTFTFKPGPPQLL